MSFKFVQFVFQTTHIYQMYTNVEKKMSFCCIFIIFFYFHYLRFHTNWHTLSSYVMKPNGILKKRSPGTRFQVR